MNYAAALSVLMNSDVWSVRSNATRSNDKHFSRPQRDPTNRKQQGRKSHSQSEGCEGSCLFSSFLTVQVVLEGLRCDPLRRWSGSVHSGGRHSHRVHLSFLQALKTAKSAGFGKLNMQNMCYISSGSLDSETNTWIIFKIYEYCWTRFVDFLKENVKGFCPFLSVSYWFKSKDMLDTVRFKSPPVNLWIFFFFCLFCTQTPLII